MRLATPADVLTTMGITSTEGSLNSAGRALDLSFPIIESILETKLSAGTTVDYFTPTSLSRRVLRLSHAFVDPDSVVVRVSDSGLPLYEDTDGVALLSTEFYVDGEKGSIVTRSDLPMHEHSVSVFYEYGLKKGSDENTLAAPYWLKEAAISMAILVLNTHPSSTANRKEKTVTNVSSSLFSLGSQMLNNYRRPRLVCLFPSRSVSL